MHGRGGCAYIGKWMSQEKTTSSSGFLKHTRVISLLTLGSRVLGLVREILAAKYFGAGVVSSAFSVGFTIPNLFRRLLGEGALSAAFIPLYSQSLKEKTPEETQKFVSGAVNLLAMILIGLSILGEGVLWGIAQIPMASGHLIAVKFTAIMLPYLFFVCGSAFLGAILQVHRRFAAIAAAPILLNILLIGSTILGSRIFDLHTDEGQFRAMCVVSFSVLIAGFLQVLMLAPSLKAVGFKFDLAAPLTSPAIGRMLRMSIPVALGAGVLQISTLLDRGISFLLARTPDSGETFRLFGKAIAFPMQDGAAARLGWAQYLYQFPLGVFAIALATAIFPMLSASAMESDREKFKDGVRKGILATIWEGLPASVGLMLIATPVVRVFLEHGRFTPADTRLTAISAMVYSSGIWAYSLQQILNRAYYALHDTKTPLVLSIWTLAINLVVEIPLLWVFKRFDAGEAGMALGTAVSFSIQAVWMLRMLSGRVGGLDLKLIQRDIIKIVIATAAMTVCCLGIKLLPFYPSAADVSKKAALIQLLAQMLVGGGVYLTMCFALGINFQLKRTSAKKSS